MITRSNWLAAVVCGAVAGLLGTSTVSAQVYGTDYITFRGEGLVLDNPTSAACQSQNINFGTTFFVLYRFSANPGVIADALQFTSGNGSVFRMLANTTPFSLNGASIFDWTLENRHGDFFSGTNASSNITIMAGNNTAVSLGTGNIKFVNGAINHLFGNNNGNPCSITNFHGAAVSIPN